MDNLRPRFVENDDNTVIVYGEPQDEIYLASFDIGKVNFAYCIEKIKISDITSIRNIPQSKRYNYNNSTKESFENVLTQIYLQGEIIEVNVIDMTIGTDTTKSLDPAVLRNITNHMDSKRDIFEKCCGFIIEQQFTGRKKGKFGMFQMQQNTMAMRVMQHLETYVSIVYPRAVITEFSSRFKTQVLGCPKERNSDSKRKTWSKHYFKDILIDKSDISILAYYMAHPKKKDDMADSYLQLQAWKYKVFIENATL